MINHIWFFVIQCLLINAIHAEPYNCCPDNGTIINKECPNGNSTWAATMCGPLSAFIFQRDIALDQFEIDKSTDQLTISPDSAISRDRYCLGKMMISGEVKDIAIICFDVEDAESRQGSTIGFLATTICCFTSTVFLLATMIVYILLPELRDLQGKCLLASVMSLFMAFIFLATVQLQNTFQPRACLIMASLLYFSFLCVFFWLNIVSFNVWRSVVRPKWLHDKKHLLLIYNAYGWGMPVIMLTIALICHHVPGSHIKPHFGHGSCWFGGTAEIWLYFYGPISLLLLMNIIMFISTAWTLWRNNTFHKEHKLRSQRFKFLLYLKLFFIMGICWTFEPLSMVWRNFRLWIVTDYINALQGILIFLLLVVFRKRVRRGLAKKGFCCFKFANTWAAMKDEECEELEEDEETCSMNSNVNNITFNELQK